MKIKYVKKRSKLKNFKISSLMKSGLAMITVKNYQGFLTKFVTNFEEFSHIKNNDFLDLLTTNNFIMSKVNSYIEPVADFGPWKEIS